RACSELGHGPLPVGEGRRKCTCDEGSSGTYLSSKGLNSLDSRVFRPLAYCQRRESWRESWSPLAFCEAPASSLRSPSEQKAVQLVAHRHRQIFCRRGGFPSSPRSERLGSSSHLVQ